MNDIIHQDDHRESIKEVEKLDKWKQKHVRSNSKAKEEMIRSAVSKNFIHAVENKTEDVLNLQPEVVFRNSVSS